MKLKLFILLFYFIFNSQNLFALQLGKINVSSKQDEPLSAVIDVIFSKNDKVKNLKPAIASKENYEANGISRLPIHSNIDINIEESGNGAKIFLTSKEIVKDPFLDLLIQIDSEKGRVYREYTILLDPPSPKAIKKEEISPKEEVNNSNKVDEIDKTKIEVSETEILPEKEIESPKEIVTKKDTPIEKVKNELEKIKAKEVKSSSGKTLYQIARENKPSGVTVEQMVLGIFKNNPNAFSEENVNTLIKNKILKLPSLDYFDDHTHIEARKILRDQNIEWKQKTKKINKPKNEKKAPNLDKDKIKELEKELIETKKKLEDATNLNKKVDDQIKEIDKVSDADNNISKKDSLANKKIEEKDKTNNQEKSNKQDDAVFISSISDVDENKIVEEVIDTQVSNGLETIHVLLLILFFILLFGLFVVISRRKSFERTQKLSNFNQNQTRSNSSEGFDQEQSDNYKPDNKDSVNINQNEDNKNPQKNDVNNFENQDSTKPDEDDKKF